MWPLLCICTCAVVYWTKGLFWLAKKLIKNVFYCTGQESKQGMQIRQKSSEDCCWHMFFMRYTICMGFSYSDCCSVGFTCSDCYKVWYLPCPPFVFVSPLFFLTKNVKWTCGLTVSLISLWWFCISRVAQHSMWWLECSFCPSWCAKWTKLVR